LHPNIHQNFLQKNELQHTLRTAKAIEVAYESTFDHNTPTDCATEVIKVSKDSVEFRVLPFFNKQVI